MSRKLEGVWAAQTLAVVAAADVREIETNELGEETDPKMAARGQWSDSAVIDPQHSNVEIRRASCRERV